MIISWPVGPAGSYLLQSRTNLTEGAWIDDYTRDPMLSGNEWQFNLLSTNQNEFFQLKRYP